MNGNKALLAAVIGLVAIAISLGVLLERLVTYACQLP